MPLHILFGVASAAAGHNNDTGRNCTLGGSVGRCLGCRVSRMSSWEEAGTWEETSAAGVKVISIGKLVTEIRDYSAIAGTFPGNYTSERLEAELKQRLPRFRERSLGWRGSHVVANPAGRLQRERTPERIVRPDSRWMWLLNGSCELDSPPR
jgi:hypothetical protein